MKIANFCTLVFYSPLKVLPSELYNADTAQKSEMMDVLGGEKKLDDMVNRLDTQPECDGRTDRRTKVLKQYRAMHADAH